MKETEAAIIQLKHKKAPGPDGVTNDMIKHLGPPAKKTLLNPSTNRGRMAQFLLYGKATLILIFFKKKKGKDKKDPNSYCLISSKVALENF